MTCYTAKVADEIDAAGGVLHPGVVETLGARQIPAQVGRLLDCSRFAGLGVDGTFRDGGLLGWGPGRVRFLEIARSAVGRSDCNEMLPCGGHLNSAVDGP